MRDIGRFRQVIYIIIFLILFLIIFSYTVYRRFSPGSEIPKEVPQNTFNPL